MSPKLVNSFTPIELNPGIGCWMLIGMRERNSISGFIKSLIFNLFLFIVVKPFQFMQVIKLRHVSELDLEMEIVLKVDHPHFSMVIKFWVQISKSRGFWSKHFLHLIFSVVLLFVKFFIILSDFFHQSFGLNFFFPRVPIDTFKLLACFLIIIADERI